MSISKEWLAFLRKQYPEGSEIRLKKMGDDPRPLPPGSTGKLHHIDDAGQLHVDWDNGRRLALVVGKDDFSIQAPSIHELKLYMPMTLTCEDRNEYGDLDDEEHALSDTEALYYLSEIHSALEKEKQYHQHLDYPDRGMMIYYSNDDSVFEKVQSYEFTAEVRNNKLWGVAVCRVRGELTPEELEILKDEIASQASDGFGEGFSQNEIPALYGSRVYAHFWTDDKPWGIYTAQELFEPEWLKSMPNRCYSVLPSSGELIVLRNGESGYYKSNMSVNSREENRAYADKENRAAGITKAQEAAWLAGTMFGWHISAADPKNYDESGRPVPPRKESLASQITSAQAKSGAQQTNTVRENKGQDR